MQSAGPMRSTLLLLLLAGAVAFAGCSSTTVVRSDPSPAPAPSGAVDGPAVCGDGARQLAEACDDGNQEDADGCTKACALTPSSMHIHSFAFHSARASASNPPDLLDYVIADTTLAKIPSTSDMPQEGTDSLDVTLASQTEGAFVVAIRRVAIAKGAPPTIVGFTGEIPRRVGAFTLPASKTFLYSSHMSGAEDLATCRTDQGEVLSESSDRRVYRVRLSGGCDSTRSVSGRVETVKATLATELTVVLLPSGTTPPAPKGVVADAAIFGTSCTLGGSIGRTAATVNTKDCAKGWCLLDGRRELSRPDGTGSYNESYCSADCTSAACPSGWECVDAPSPGGDARVCQKEVAVCGDARRQPDEACDDGNRYEQDGCSATCKTVRPGAQLVVQKLLVGNTSYGETLFPKLPMLDPATGAARVDALSDVAARVWFTLSEGAAATFEIEVALPRSVGRVDVSAASPFYVSVSNNGMARYTPAGAVLEVLEVGADDRSLRAKFTASIGPAPGTSVESTFVVTLR